MDRHTVLHAVSQQHLTPDQEPHLDAFLRWHARGPHAHLADPRGVWKLYQSIKPHLPDASAGAITEEHIEYAVLLHLLSLVRPPLSYEEQQDIVRFWQAEAFECHHLTGIVDTYRRLRVYQQRRAAEDAPC